MGVTEQQPPSHDDEPSPRFPADLLHSAARLYYLEDANQSTIAERLGISRATVSRMLSEARRVGIVRIEVVPPAPADRTALAERLATALGVTRVHLTSSVPDAMLGSALADGVTRSLEALELRPGDGLLLSSGRTVFELTNAPLPQLPGIEVSPMIGGQDEPEAWYQPNEIVRRFAAKVGGHPRFLYAPALPSAELHVSLQHDESFNRVISSWSTARCAIVGVGPPPLTRESIPGFVPTSSPTLRDAVGDICSRFYDRDGVPVEFPGSDRLVSTELTALRSIPVTIAVAVGEAKVVSIAAAARAGYFTELVTDTATATSLLAHVAGSDAAADA